MNNIASVRHINISIKIYIPFNCVIEYYKPLNKTVIDLQRMHLATIENAVN